MVYDGHMDNLKKLALTVALFLASWLLAAAVFAVVLWLHDYMGQPWYRDAIAFGVGVGAVRVYERLRDGR